MFLNVVLEFVKLFLHKMTVNGLLTMAPLTISKISAVNAVNDIEIVNSSFKKTENITNDTNVPLII